MKTNHYKIKCGWGLTVAKLEYVHEGVCYWTAKNGFKFITHDLKDAVKILN